MAVYKWTKQDIDDLLAGTKNLIGSSNYSSFEKNELLLLKPQFINNILLQLIADQLDDENQVDTKKKWIEVIGHLRWLLNQSLLYNNDSNNDTEASLFFSKNNHLPLDVGGRESFHSTDTLTEMIQWFPELSLEQIRKNVNFVTFLVEKISPADESDVKLLNDEVLMWFSLNLKDKKRKILKPLSTGTKPAKLRKVVSEVNPYPRYGLQFDESEENVYRISSTSDVYLRDKEQNVILTFTFLVGTLPAYEEEEMLVNEIGEQNVGKEQFIINDHHWADKIQENFRGVSIVYAKNNLFELFLHRASSPESNEGKNRLKIAENLHLKRYYTLQIKWGAEIEHSDGSVQVLPSFYALYNFEKCLNKTSFQQNSILKDETFSAFYIGGFVTRTANTLNNLQVLPRILHKSNSRNIKSKCFTGILSNLEILMTKNKHAPAELFKFIAIKQVLKNPKWTNEQQIIDHRIKKDVLLSSC